MHDQLLLEIVEDPTDDARWDVFVDWLIARGDPRGELAVASDPAPLLRSLVPEWFGLGEGLEVRVAGGRVVVGGDEQVNFPSQSWVAFEFERGHVRRLQMDVTYDSRESDEVGPRWGAEWIPALVQRVLSQPIGRLIQTVEIRQRPDWSGDLRCDALLDALISGGLPAARTLAWGSRDDWEFVELPDCAPLLLAAPRLESATLQGEGGLQSAVVHPRLRELGVGAMQPDSLVPFVNHDLRALEQLTVWLEFDDAREVDAQFEVERLSPLFEASLPSLRTLVFPRCPEPEAVRATLRDAPWFAQIETLTLA